MLSPYLIFINIAPLSCRVLFFFLFKFISMVFLSKPPFNALMSQLKIVTLGTANVGKTCLLDRWVNKAYRPNQDPTCHAGYLHKRVELDGESHSFQLWDTAGQDKFRSTTQIYCRNAKAALIVFDKSDPATFNVLLEYIALLHNSAGPNVPIVIAANKADLDGGVSTEEIADFCRENGELQFFETSALNGMNVDDAFEVLCRAAIAKNVSAGEIEILPQPVEIAPPKNTAQEAPPANQGGGPCC
jgi:small GTP-binding protein